MQVALDDIANVPAMRVPNRLEEFRKQRGLNTTELAARIGVAERTLRRYETQRLSIPDATKLRLAEELNVTPSELMGWE